MIYFPTHVDDGVSVEEPHDPGLGVPGDPAHEPGALALAHLLRLRLRHEARLELLRVGLDQIWMGFQRYQSECCVS